MHHLDHRHDLASFGGERGGTWGVVWTDFRDEWVSRFCAVNASLLATTDGTMMAPMLGLTSNPAELGCVLPRIWPGSCMK